jgi:hypothetical protein
MTPECATIGTIQESFQRPTEPVFIPRPEVNSGADQRQSGSQQSAKLAQRLQSLRRAEAAAKTAG